MLSRQTHQKRAGRPVTLVFARQRLETDDQQLCKWKACTERVGDKQVNQRPVRVRCWWSRWHDWTAEALHAEVLLLELQLNLNLNARALL